MRIKGIFANTSSGFKMIMFLALIVLGFIILTGAIWVVAFVFTKDYNSAFNLISHPLQNLSFLKSIQILQHIFVFLLPPVFAAIILSVKTNYFFPENAKSFKSSWLLVIVFMIAALPLINATSFLNELIKFPDALSGLENLMKRLEEQNIEILKVLLSYNSVGGMLVNVVMIAVLPAIAEELMFRGVFQRLFSNMLGTLPGILLTAAIFSAIHLQFYGFIPRFLLGVLFGYLLVWTGSIWIPILAHFVNNFMAVMYYQLIANPTDEGFIDTVGTTQNTLVYLIVSIGISVAIIYKLRAVRHPIKN